MNKAVDSTEIMKVDEVKSVHVLLEDAVTQIAGQWIEQIKISHDNLAALENQIVACVAKTKSDISLLHDLGVKVSEEARRGQKFCQELSDSVGKIAS